MRKYLFAPFLLLVLITACAVAPPTIAPTIAPTLPAPTAPPPTAVPPPPTPATRVIPIPSVAPNPNVQDPTFLALPNAKAFSRQVAGSGYRIEVPDKWNGDLILYAHGYRGVTTTLTISSLPIREAVVQQGYAWAASSYRANGYNPEDGVQDTLILRELFRQMVSAPKRTYLYGTSMGGHVTVASLEQYPDVYAGAVSECGVVSGIAEYDYLLSFTLLGGYFSGVDFTAPENKTLPAAGALMQQKVLPTLGPAADQLTDAGLRLRNATINLTGGHRPFAEQGFADRYLTNLPAGLGILLGSTYKEKAAGNADEKYHVDSGMGVDDAMLNAGIKRVAADPSARNFDSHYEFTRFKGNLKVPLLTLHDTGDFFVPIVLEQQYAQTVKAAGASSLLVQRAVRRFKHCDFTTGARPEGEDLSGSLIDVGKKWTEPPLPDDPGNP